MAPGIVEMNEQRELAAVFLMRSLYVRSLLDRIHTRRLEEVHGFVSDDRSPIDLVAEWPLTARLTVGCILVTGLDDDIAIYDGAGGQRIFHAVE